MLVRLVQLCMSPRHHDFRITAWPALLAVLYTWAPRVLALLDEADVADAFVLAHTLELADVQVGSRGRRPLLCRLLMCVVGLQAELQPRLVGAVTNDNASALAVVADTTANIALRDRYGR